MSEAITRASSNPAPVAESGAIELDKLDDKHLEGNETAHLPNVPGAHDDTIHGINAKGEVVDPHGSAGLAVIEQRSAIPTTGKRLITSKREYWLFVIMYFASNGSPISGTAGNLRQAMIQLEFPKGYMNWAGSYQPVDTVLLDLNGILFAVQLVILFAIGPYADYGNWRPWILIIAQVVTWGCEFGMIGIKHKSQWALANGIWIVGRAFTYFDRWNVLLICADLAQNVFTAYYFATYPGLVRDLPRMIQSEQDVAAGVKTPEEHGEMDSFERAKIFNLCNVYGSASAVVWFGIAIGISHAVGYASEDALIRSYRILMGYYTPLMILVTVPFFVVMKWRPGQQIPKGLSMWQSGPKQAWYALKCAAQLKQCLLYLVAYFFLFEAIGAYVGVYIILQLQAIKFSPELSSAFNLVGDFAGGAGCAIILWLHKRYHWKVKWILFVSAIFSIFPILWGAVGTWTHKIGYYNTWEFWFFQVWNICTSAAASYNVTMISEVAPASKLFMFYSLFQTLSKTSGFIGPFITAAIIKRANGNTNAAFWFLLALGAISLVLLFFIDTDKAKIDCAKLAEREAQELYSEEQREAGRANQLGKEDLIQAESKV